MKKNSDSPIENIKDLGNGTFQFCYNQKTETVINPTDNTERISYSSDYTVVRGIPEYGNIVDTLICDKYPNGGQERSLINNYLEDLKTGVSTSKHITEYEEYQSYRVWAKGLVKTSLNIT